MRLRGIGPEVLLLCFLVVGAAAFALGRRSARGRRVRSNVDYFTGLDHLVNDRFDRATEVFSRLATNSNQAEIQFALGSLMRRRGEVDRAIAIHMELAGHREPAIREQATFALGLDYMSAGLLDRAEEKLRSLLGSAQYRAAVLEKLAWVYEQQRDWRGALDIWRELPPEKQRERASVAAHYCCELAEAALAARDFDAARTQVAAARVHDPASARAAILAARIAAAAGETDKAVDLYAHALSASSSIRDAFMAEAENALGARAPQLAERLRARPPQQDVAAPERARFRCVQCGITSVTWHWRCPGCRSYDSLQSVNNRDS
jgi:lipopolysaccharide biosynthesis regulator YciM